MKKDLLFAAIIIFLVFSLSVAFSGEVKPKINDETMWDLYSPKGEFLGKIKKEKERFVFYDKDEISLEKTDKNKWKMRNQENEFVGTLQKDKGKDRYKFFDKQEKHLGVILESKKLMPRGHRSDVTQLSPEAAKFYLDVLNAIETIE